MTHDRFRMTDDRFRPQVMAAERALDELEDHAADRLGAARRAIQELERTATAALKEENRRLTSRVSDLEEEKSQLIDQMQELEQELLKLRAAPAAQATVSRVITAEEAKVGQLVAVWDPAGDGDVLRVSYIGSNEDGDTTLQTRGGVYWPVSVGTTIVLLEDAPAEEPEPVKVGDSVGTAAELDGLPNGSVVLDYFDDAHQKAGGAWWEALRDEGRDAAEMIACGPFTAIYLPKEGA